LLKQTPTEVPAARDSVTDRQRRAGSARMLADIRAEAAPPRRLIGKDAGGPRVMAAMAEVPRDTFGPDNLRASAYANRLLPIGHAQTISQSSGARAHLG
jgi:protein-L-isoaspartate(D-aspartate) O-methyltransferase